MLLVGHKESKKISDLKKTCLSWRMCAILSAANIIFLLIMYIGLNEAVLLI